MEFESGVSLGSLETARFCRSICPRWSLTFLLVKCYGYLLALSLKVAMFSMNSLHQTLHFMKAALEALSINSIQNIRCEG